MTNAKLHLASLIDSAFLSCLAGLIAVGHLCKRKKQFLSTSVLPVLSNAVLVAVIHPQ